MYRVEQTEVFASWLRKLRDPIGKARIIARIESCRLGNLGDAKSVGGGVHELRIHAGPGYRVYFANRGGCILLLLCGGSKSNQRKDIRRAQKILGED